MHTPAQFLAPDADGVLTPKQLGLVDCTNEEYHGGSGISKSHLDKIGSKSPMHYWHRYLNPDREPDEPTPALVLGQAVHSIVLEPDTFEGAYAINPGIDRRSNAGKAEFAQFVAESAGKTIITDDQAQACYQIRDAVHRHPLAKGLLSAGKAEQSFYAVDEETGELIKCRTDFLPDNGSMIVDVKSTDDASPSGFAKSSANYRYPVQTAWYQRVIKSYYGECPPHWVFLAFEKEPPYAIGVYFTQPEDVARAAIAAQRDFMRIVEHKRLDYWPDYGTEALPLNMPTWWRP